MKQFHSRAALAASALLAVFAPAWAQTSAIDGARIYSSACVACHGTGAANAPRVGDAKRWAPLIAEGQAILTAHGYVGVRGMPAKGGKPDLKVEEFAAALVHMVNSSGGKWAQPDAKGLDAIRKEITKREAELRAKGSAK